MSGLVQTMMYGNQRRCAGPRQLNVVEFERMVVRRCVDVKDFFSITIAMR